MKNIRGVVLDEDGLVLSVRASLHLGIFWRLLMGKRNICSS